MLPANVGLVKTCHSGLDKHKQFEDDPMQTDLVLNRVVGSNSGFRETKNNVRETLKYETINDWTNMTYLANLTDIIESWNVDIEISYAEFEKLKISRQFRQWITNDGTINKMDDALAQVCVDELKNFTIHNYPQPMAMKLSLLCVFSVIYAIIIEQIRAQGLENLHKFYTLTPNAEKNYDQASVPNKIDLSDEFTLFNMKKKAANGEYENEEKKRVGFQKITSLL
ncbi:MAG: hypothetical protein EZS28_001389 [Streblomastix strix]|uniref:Uncharacterized protein n=1 Tax=Streblomastix strix TaxID=222440 RepID=A0A5J4X771_9EUKA|nr:MAG: hypothetical protein EZS28_001389 [Streblomastix strix]